MTHHMLVGYLGPLGTYSHAAALKRYPDEELRPYTTLESVVEAVKNREVEQAVLPIENSTNGEVRAALDALVAEIGECPEIKAIDEVRVHIAHQVFSRSDNVSEVKTLYSHPQVWGQVTNWVTSTLPEAKCIDCDSTSQAIERAWEDKNGAAIAGAAAGSVYGVKPLVANVADREENTTRFLVIAREPAPENKQHIMITFCAAQQDLCKALEAFVRADVQVTFLTSRSRGTDWTYRYIVEFSGELTSEKVKKALENLEQVTNVTVIGAY